LKGPKGQRLDDRLVADGLAESRSRAQALIRAGRVLVDDTPRDKPGARVADGARLRLRGEERRFVSRGGDKLSGALSDLRIDPAGRVCLDVGASTGGFTDCLLQAGARRVTAVDVGYGQLASRLRADPRVRVLERTNARGLSPEALPEAVDLVTVDVSFISRLGRICWCWSSRNSRWVGARSGRAVWSATTRSAPRRLPAYARAPRGWDIASRVRPRVGSPAPRGIERSFCGSAPRSPMDAGKISLRVDGWSVAPIL
jgi:TlyA family rRNA methyltransferase/putative hemolysin